jgi:hypothetical protein
MAATDKNSVTVELYDLAITECKDDRFGRVATTKSLNETDLINIAISRGTELSISTMQASLSLLKNIAKEQIANGASVSFGLGYFNLLVNGIFIGDSAKWNSDIHALSVGVTPTAELREAVKSVSVDVRGMAEVGTIINSVTDVTSGEVNSRLTPGGGANLSGSKIKVIGDHPTIGIRLINQATNKATVIPFTSLLNNDPSRIMLIVPATLAKGDYKLSLTTQFSTSGSFLKEPRTYIFDCVLNVAV